MIQRTLSLLVSGLVVLAGCAPTVAFMPLNTPPHTLEERAPASVEVYSTNRPTKPYVEVGVIQTESILVGGNSSLELIEAVRTEGAKHGCDAVVIDSENKGAQATAGYVARESTTGFRAVCAVFE